MSTNPPAPRGMSQPTASYPPPVAPRPVQPLQVQPLHAPAAAVYPAAAPPQGLVDRGTMRQWEARVRRMARRGEAREQILYHMTDANWPYDQADQFLRRMASSERWRAVGIMAATGVIALIGIGLLIVDISSSTNFNGGGAGFIVFGLVGFIYGLVRLIKIRG